MVEYYKLDEAGQYFVKGNGKIHMVAHSEVSTLDVETSTVTTEDTLPDEVESINRSDLPDSVEEEFERTVDHL